MTIRQNQILFVLATSLFYCIFFGISLQYATEIAHLELPGWNAFYITQANYCICFVVVFAITVGTNQRFVTRLIIISTLVNLLAALSYTIFHLLTIGDWNSLWRAVGTYSGFFLLFILANFTSHLVAEMLARNLERPDNPLRPESVPDHLSASMRYAYDSLGKRTEELRRSATVAILGIVAVLIASALLFIFAGQIATLGNLRVDAYDEARSLQERQVRRFDNSFSELTSSLSSLKTQASQAGPAATAQPTIEKLSNIADSIKSSLDRANKIDEELRGMREKLIQAQIEGKKNIDAEFMIFSSVTRFGVLGISAYLVYILVNLYRFNILQSVFYESIRDAILINGKISLSDMNAAKHLRSEINFGKMHEKTLTAVLSELRSFLGKNASNSDGTPQTNANTKTA